MSKRFRPSLSISFLLIIASTSLVNRVFSQAPGIKAVVREGVAGASALLEEAAQLRGLKVLRPVSSGMKTRTEIEAIVIKDFDESSTPDEIEAQRKMLVAFGLIPKDFRYREFIISLLTEQVAGFYEAKSREFFLADWNDPEMAKPVIVHELTHALQDQHFDLRRFEKWPRGDGDRELAIHALIEGDATAVMINYVLKPSGMDITRLPMSLTSLNETMSAESAGDREKVLASAPPAIRESLLFPYSFGAGFVQEVVRRQKWEGLSRAYTDLPQSTEQIMHIEKYLARENPARIEPASLLSILGPEWKRLADDVTGEFGYFLILTPYLPKAEAREAAAGWGADRAVLYENIQTGELLLAHISDWDSAGEAGEFFRAYVTRVSKRYDGRNPVGAEGNRRTFANSQASSMIEQRGQRVVAIEGVPTALSVRMGRLAAALWK
ncbi:MAG: hypothetical protein ABI882_23855 [Acidobacteriota bacterium]